jgi:ADP-ribose pyrophosphatase YjhB (NUDIX family)
LHALGQTGLAFSDSPYDERRYQRLMEIAAEIIASYSQLDRELLVKNFLAHPGYATPKIDVRGAVVKDGEILLVQERSDECWCMPGGWADVGESPSAMVSREVLEESGFAVTPVKVVGVYDANRAGGALELYHAYKVVFLCMVNGGAARPSEETMAVKFFPFDRLPQLSINRTGVRHLEDVRAHLLDPTRAVTFD